MQAGISGGMMPSECGQPIRLDRPALYFPDVRFVLSHTGYPWVDEAVALARKARTYSSAPARTRRAAGRAALVDLVPSGKVVFGTNFPTVGHAQAAAQLVELGIDRPALDRAAHCVFTRLES